MAELQDGLARSPLWVRRPGLLLQGVRVDRDRPDLENLKRASSAEGFVWAVLPHAARSFAPCILCLPSSIALPVAVGYLYCRVLDTYEDLAPVEAERVEALAALPRRLTALRSGGSPPTLPSLRYECRDGRDRAHAMIAEEVSRLDVLFQGFPAPVQGALVDLVSDMAEGMRWASGIFRDQDGVLDGGDQLRRYCSAVLGNPIRFAARLFQWVKSGTVELTGDVEAAVWDVGELLQLANITRDIEKDFSRGVSYHPALRPLAEARVAEDRPLICSARSSLCDRALSLAPSYLALVDGMGLRSGLMSSSALMMLLFTEQHYRVSVGLAAGGSGGRSSGRTVILKALPAALSGRWARSQMGRVVGRMEVLRSELPAQASSMYLS